MRKKIRNIIIYLFTLVILSGCATTHYFQKGEEAFLTQKWDEAIDYYLKALQADPQSPRIRLSLAKAYVLASKYHYELGEVLYKKGDIKIALIEYQKALDIYPENQNAKLKKNKILKDLAVEQEKSREKSELEMVKEKMAKVQTSPVPLSVDSTMKFDMAFRDTFIFDVFNTLQRIGGINIILDEQVPIKKISGELSKVTFIQALENLTITNTCYYKIIDDRNIIIIPDNTAKRKQYDELVVKTMYLSHLDVKDAQIYLKLITAIEYIALDANSNALTIRATPGKVEAAERILNALDKPQGDALIDIEIFEVNKTRMREYGLDLSNYQLAASVTSSDQTLETSLIRGDELDSMTASNLLFSIPSIIYKLMSSDVKSKFIAKPQIRVKGNELARVRIGDKVPIPATTFVPYAAGGVAQQPITSFVFENIGINIDVTPKIHLDGTITLKLIFELTFITTPGSATVPPVIGNRSFTSVIRLKDGETNLLAGLLRDTERKSLVGIPGIVKIPIIGALFGSNSNEISQTDIILAITPRILGYPTIADIDLSAFGVGTEINFELKSASQLKKK
jgi:general secretion pathway protein D